MAVVLFKNGESVRVDISSVAGHLAAGYSYTDGPEESEREDDPTIEDPRTPAMVRQQAKDAGLDNWETARIKTLKASLNDDQS